jgi:hypothetical protein
MNRLDWHGHTFQHPNINIDILQGAHRTNKGSIYHIHWEHLEQVQKQNWPGLASNTNPLHVRVRRVLDPPMKTPRSSREDVYKPDKKINVLLVIARKLKRGSSGLEDLSPAMVYRSIMKVKKVFLPKEHSRITLNLEVVRPGSFVALADHLERKKAEHGIGFFHLVHFDLHGEVSGEGERQVTQVPALCTLPLIIIIASSIITPTLALQAPTQSLTKCQQQKLLNSSTITIFHA